MSELTVGNAVFGPTTADASQGRALQDAMRVYDNGASEAEAKLLIAELERELGVKGTLAVFRKSLALAKAARAALG